MVVVLVALMLGQLFNFQRVLSQLSEDSYPSAIQANYIYTEASILLNLVEKLSSTTNELRRKELFAELEIKVQQLKRTVEQEQLSSSNAQSGLISKELFTLNGMVAERIELATKIAEQQVYLREFIQQLQMNIRSIRQQLAPKDEFHQWMALFSQIISKVYLETNMYKVSYSSQSEKEVEMTLSLMNELSRQLETVTPIFSYNTQKLAHMLTGKAGIFSTNEKLVNTKSQIVGQTNYLNSLVTDFVNWLQFMSYKKGLDLNKQTQSAANQVQIQVYVFIGLGVGLFIIAFVVKNHMTKRLVSRLIALHRYINSPQKVRNDLVFKQRDDEITELYDAFVQYSTELENQKQQLKLLSQIDPLTQLSNRRAIEDKFNVLRSIAVRQQQPLAILMMDVDCFKQYNDFYGHQAGDQCLIQVAAAIESSITREVDLVGRYGGEEFIAILPNTSSDGAAIIANKIISHLNRQNIPHEKSAVAKHITISIGVYACQLGHSDNLSTLVELADKALYQAKREGRNCFRIADK
jgi:diguanylate cyclase (GGDEF)-like protein